MTRKRRRETFVCPHCGAEVPVGAQVCRECGSDEETGWSDDAEDAGAEIGAGYGGVDDFDYEAFLERELPDQATVPLGRSWKRWAWRAVVVITSLALLRYWLVV